MILYGVMNLTKCKSIYFNDTCTWNDLYFCTFVPPNEWIMEKDYFSHILPNGLRIVHLPSASPVSYCGFAVNAGTRDEEMDEFEKHFNEYKCIEVVFVNQDVLLTTSQEKLLQNIDVRIIPDCYFDFELREVGELW